MLNAKLGLPMMCVSFWKLILFHTICSTFIRYGKTSTLVFICDILHGGGVLYWTELHNNSVLMYISMQVHYKLPIIPL